MFDSGSNTFLFGALSFGVASLLYVFYGPSKSRKPRNSNANVSGLVNYGNHCFVNAVLQAIAPCKSMINWLGYSVAQQSQDEAAFDNYRTDSLAYQLRRTINVLNNSDTHLGSANPIDIITALRAHRWAIPDDEQDACELFNVLTSTLEWELCSALPKFSLRDALLIDELVSTSPSPVTTQTISTRSTNLNCQIDNRIPRSLPTKGMLASQLHCRKCKYRYPVHLDTFDTISLVIPSNIYGTPILLRDCLNKFVSNEIINEVNCEGCLLSAGDNSNVSIKSAFIKKLTFAKLPQLLCLHIQRLVWLGDGQLFKRHDHVAFPEYLSMDSFAYHSQKSKLLTNSMSSVRLIGGASTPTRSQPIVSEASGTVQLASQMVCDDVASAKYKYKLHSVIVHLGDATSGHFICYRRNLTNQSDWYYCSDNNIIRVDLNEVLHRQAYLLFYERFCN